MKSNNGVKEAITQVESVAETPALPGHRKPPVVIIVPPLPGGTIHAITAPVLIGMVVGPLLLGALLARAPWNWRFLIAAGIVTALGTTIFLLVAGIVRKERRRIEAFVAATKHDFDRPGQRELRKLWAGFTSVAPNLRRIREALRTHGLQQPGRAMVLVFDTMMPREAEPYSFEPVILTPTQRVGWHVYTLIIIAAWFGIWLIARAMNIYLPFEPWRTTHAYAIALIAAWAWYKAAVHAPEYIRLAPGVIQFVRFERGRAKPVIRSFVMNEDVLLVFMHFGKGESLLISTPSAAETIAISLMSNSAVVVEDFWRAILCTAPTPPLSADELIG